MDGTKDCRRSVEFVGGNFRHSRKKGDFQMEQPAGFLSMVEKDSPRPLPKRAGLPRHPPETVADHCRPLHYFDFLPLRRVPGRKLLMGATSPPLRGTPMRRAAMFLKREASLFPLKVELIESQRGLTPESECASR